MDKSKPKPNENIIQKEKLEFVKTNLGNKLEDKTKTKAEKQKANLKSSLAP